MTVFVESSTGELLPTWLGVGQVCIGVDPECSTVITVNPQSLVDALTELGLL